MAQKSQHILPPKLTETDALLQLKNTKKPYKPFGIKLSTSLRAPFQRWDHCKTTSPILLIVNNDGNTWNFDVALSTRHRNLPQNTCLPINAKVYEHLIEFLHRLLKANSEVECWSFVFLI